MGECRKIMTNMREITISQLVSKINKKGVFNLSKEDLMDVLRYYAKLSVVYIDNDEKVMFLWVVSHFLLKIGLSTGRCLSH